ncbi:MAG: gliding motility-associated C-terminal domain-containing protein [Bacteroidia bacterium]
MKRVFGIIFSLFLFGSLTAQDTILNAYAKVIEIDSCFIRVDTTLGFYPEDFVLVHQAKGAAINKTNSSDYGKLIKYNGAGLFEENKIQTISRDTIYLYKQVNGLFNVNFNVQIVGIRPVNKIISPAKITCKRWDSATGGIVYLKARDSIVLNHNIDVSGLGYNGGNVSQTRVKCNYDDFFCDYQTGFGGAKGESMVLLKSNTACRGASANGGGGGNTSNTGGGGGSNAGMGGLGGKEVSFGSGACSNARVGGVGGKAILYDTLFGAIPRNSLQRIFFGGGGGGGQQNNEQSDGVAGVQGLSGGGIIFINTKKLVSKNIDLLTNGMAVTDTAGRDGAGGGGAGGTVALFVDSYQGKISVEANGGDGGSVDNNGFNSFCHGPGGGGGGGLLWLKQLSVPNNFSFSAKKGKAGINVNSTSRCYQESHGAQNGADGYILFDMKLNTASISRANCPNLNPIAVDDTFSIREGETIGYNILNNDTINGIFKTKLLRGKSLATIKLIKKDSINYNNFTPGLDTFQYCICRKYEPILCDTANIIVNVIARNQFVFLENDSTQINEGDSVKIDFLANDTLKGKSTFCLNYTGPNRVEFNNDTSAISFYSLNRNLGIDSFEYCACLVKNPSICDTAWVFVNVLADTSSPKALDDTYRIVKGIDTCLFPLKNDTFIRDINFVITNTNTKQTISFQNDSSFCLSNFDSLPDTIILKYSICYSDTPRTCDSAEVIIIVGPDPNAPICQDDNYDVVQDSVYEFVVAINDIIPSENNVLTIISAPTRGVIPAILTYRVQYEATDTFVGKDSFQYKLTSPIKPYSSDSAWVYLNISLPNKRPVAINDFYKLFKDGEVEFDPLENDIDPDSNLINFDRFIGNLRQGVLTGSAPPFIYTPDLGFSGRDSIDYNIVDNGEPNKKSKASIIFEVIDKPEPKVYNGFSPNNDGVNDFFKVENAEVYDDLKLVVFNRWGQVLYTNNAYKNEWIGLDNNENELSDGTYFYVITIDSINYKKEGYVGINR